jgi:hypothetical protein
VGAVAGALPDLPAGDEGKLCARLLKLLAIQSRHEALLCCRCNYLSNLSSSGVHYLFSPCVTSTDTGVIGCGLQPLSLCTDLQVLFVRESSVPHLPCPSFPPTGAPAEADDLELQRAINQLAELALLGGGHADQLFPDSLDEMYAAALDEAPFRVVL